MTMNGKGRLAIVVVAGLIAAGVVVFFLTNRQDARSFESVSQLVVALESDGIKCENLTLSSAEQTRRLGGEFGVCQIAGKSVNIHVYEDPTRVEEHVRNNVSVRGDNPNYFTSLVYGHTWVVDTYSEETSADIERAIGGKIE